MHSLDTIKKLNGEFPEEAAKPIKFPYDTGGALFAYESGELNKEATIELFQHLVDTGLAWQLQGSYGRQAMRFIEAGLVRPVGV